MSLPPAQCGCADKARAEERKRERLWNSAEIGSLRIDVPIAGSLVNTQVIRSNACTPLPTRNQSPRTAHRQHKTLRVSPAMAAGLTDERLDMSALLKLINGV